MSTAIIISIVVIFILILSGVGIYFYMKKNKEEETPKEEDENNEEETQPPSPDVNAEAPSKPPASSIGSDDVMIGDSNTWNREGKIICGITTPKAEGNLFCTDYSINNRFKAMKKKCIDIDVDQTDKRIFCINQDTKKVEFLTLPTNGLIDHKDDMKWNNSQLDKNNMRFQKISVNTPNIIGLGEDKHVYRFASSTGWTKLGDLKANEIAAVRGSNANVGYVMAPNVADLKSNGFRIYGYGIQGSQNWFSVPNNWESIKIDAGSVTEPNRPVVCQIGKNNKIYCQTTTFPTQEIVTANPEVNYDNINISNEKDLFLTDVNKNVYYIDLGSPSATTGNFPQVTLNSVKFTKVAA